METLFIGQNQYFLEQVNSTNTYAIELLRNVNTPEGTIVHTDRQTSGKGQRGNTWSSETASNITVSIILAPVFLTAQKAFYLSKITALAVHDVLTENTNTSQFDIKIKWPNDILMSGKKVAGILIENQLTQHALSHSVVGIGLNVNQTGFDMLQSASSLKNLTGLTYDRQTLLEQLCAALEKWYLRLKSGKHTAINQAYFNALFGYKETHIFEDQAGQIVAAYIMDVTENGLLELLLPDGITKHYDIKEIKLVR